MPALSVTDDTVDVALLHPTITTFRFPAAWAAGYATLTVEADDGVAAATRTKVGATYVNPFVSDPLCVSGLVTLTVVAPAACGPVRAVIDVALTTVTFVAATPPMVTVAPATNRVPVMVTFVPPFTPPTLGAMAVTVGACAAVTVKFVALVAVPPGVVTAIGPVVAPVGTVVVIVVAFVTVKVGCDVPLNVTPVAPVRLVPVMVTAVPVAPVVGVKLVTVGAATVTVKFEALVAVPPGVTTWIGPLVAPVGTVVVIVVALTTVKVGWFVALNRTLVAPVRPVPVIVTATPTAPLVGVKLVTVGTGTTVKVAALVAVPPGVTTAIGPLVAPAGTVVVIVVALTTVNVGCDVPLKVTPVAPVRLVPVMVTAAPTMPLVGVKPVTVGTGSVTVKLVALVAVPPGVTTVTGPLVAAAGTVVVIVVALTTVNVGCDVPLNDTLDAPVRLVPEIVTATPTAPLVGVKPVTVGTGSVTVKFVALVAVPPAVTTAIGPLVAPAGTVVVIVEASTTVNAGWLVVLNRTVVAPVRSVPVIVTAAPTTPLVGVKLVTVGTGTTVKFVALVAVPPGVTTAIGPLVAAAGTVVVIVVALTTVNVGCDVPLNVTLVAPVRLVPVMVTAPPTGPLVGVKLVTVGTGSVTVKFVALVAVPPGVTTAIGPLVAAAGTDAVIVVAFTTVKLGWLVPLNDTLVAPVRLVPVIVTAVPTVPLVGVKLVTVGAGTVTVKFVALVAVPPAVTTASGPLVAPAGTVVVIVLSSTTVKVGWFVPLKRTAVAPVSAVPEIVTGSPGDPLAGVRPVSVGTGTTV